MMIPLFVWISNRHGVPSRSYRCVPLAFVAVAGVDPSKGSPESVTLPAAPFGTGHPASGTRPRIECLP
jgi:hypothetical protein